jgi:hypothetical protein
MTKQGKSVSLFVDGARLKSSAHSALACTDCHKGLNPREMPHAKVIPPVRCQSCHKTAGFEKSVHGKPLDGSGKKRMPAAQCKTCHGTHEVRRVRDPQSAVNPMHVSETCGKCHGEAEQKYRTSAHGIAPGKGT